MPRSNLAQLALTVIVEALPTRSRHMRGCTVQYWLRAEVTASKATGHVLGKCLPLLEGFFGVTVLYSPLVNKDLTE